MKFSGDEITGDEITGNEITGDEITSYRPIYIQLRSRNRIQTQKNKSKNTILAHRYFKEKIVLQTIFISS